MKVGVPTEIKEEEYRVALTAVGGPGDPTPTPKHRMPGTPCSSSTE